MREAQPAPVMELAEKLFRDSLAKRMEIDQLIRAHSHHWQIDRMSSVDRNILRVGVCELLTVEASQAPVVINEALEVAKKYSGEDSSKFINGVLDGIRIALRSQSEKNASPEKRTTAHLEDSE
jgi:N utilization substance protein B